MLCIRSPYPPNDGGAIAMYNNAISLAASGADVKILSFNTKKHYVDPGSIPGWFRDKFNPSFIYLDATVKPIPALINIFSNDSYNISRFDALSFHEALEKLLQLYSFDVIQLESLFMTPYISTIRKYSKAAIVLRAHNVEHIIWKRLAASSSNPVKKWYLHMLSQRLQQYETTYINKLDGLVALTPEDKATFLKLGSKVPSFVSPIGIDTDKYNHTESLEGLRSIAHLGAMDWLPNIEGVDWFLDKVYPGLLKTGVEFSVHLAGKGMADYMFAKSDNHLHIYGKIEHINDFFTDKQIMIVPLLSGGGMRVKIIEGLAMGKTIITTTIGAEGIRYTNGENMIIADTPGDFVAAITRCLADPGYSRKLGRSARKLAEQEYENKVVGGRLVEFYHTEILGKVQDGSFLAKKS